MLQRLGKRRRLVTPSDQQALAGLTEQDDVRRTHKDSVTIPILLQGITLGKSRLLFGFDAHRSLASWQCRQAQGAGPVGSGEKCSARSIAFVAVCLIQPRSIRFPSEASFSSIAVKPARSATLRLNSMSTASRS